MTELKNELSKIEHDNILRNYQNQLVKYYDMKSTLEDLKLEYEYRPKEISNNCAIVIIALTPILIILLNNEILESMSSQHNWSWLLSLLFIATPAGVIVSLTIYALISLYVCIYIRTRIDKKIKITELRIKRFKELKESAQFVSFKKYK